MTLTSTTTKSQYNGDGSTTAFATGFKFIANADVKVIHRDASGTETTWTLNGAGATGYTLTGAGEDAGGTVTANTAPASGTTLTVKRAAAETQSSDLPAGGAFPSDTVEDALDRLTMLVQAHTEEFSRAVLIKETTALSDLEFPEASASALIAWNSAATALENVSAADVSLTTVSSFINTLLDDADAATARTTLGLGTAATQNTGTSGANVPLLNAANTHSGVTTFSETVLMSGAPVEFAEGAAVASAATTDIWTPDDGQTVHITGTTTITSLGTAPQAGALRFCVFDGALTLTDGASLILPGNANITTAADDCMLVYADTTTVMRVMGYWKGDGTSVAAGSSGLTFLSRVDASGAADIEFTNSTISATYDQYLFIFQDVKNDSASQDLHCRLSTDNGSTYTSGGNYSWVSCELNGGTPTETNNGASGDTEIVLVEGQLTTAEGQGLHGQLWLHNVNETVSYTMLNWSFFYNNAAGSFTHSVGGGFIALDQDQDAIKLYSTSGNVSGEVVAYGIANS